VRLRTTRVVLAAAHLDHDPTNNRLLRRASGDLFLGPYGRFKVEWSGHPVC
jgi:hypothetical protein